VARSKQNPRLQRYPVHGLKLGVRVHQQHVDLAPLQQALGAGGKLGGAPGFAFYAMGALNEQIHITTPGGIINARTKQADLTVIPQFKGKLLLQGKTL
jgi:hypothetical protein